MTPCLALLRGVNVGRAKRVAMADLRSLLESLGFSEVRTVLNSGNAVFRVSETDVRKIAVAIEVAIGERFGFAVPVVVLGAPALNDIVAANPLIQASADPSRFLVAFAGTDTAMARARPLLAQCWAPDALAVGRDAAYLWCACGIIESRLAQAFARATGASTTTRNWATVLKLQSMAGAGRAAD